MFPAFFDGLLGVSIVGRGIEDGIFEVFIHDLREHGIGRHRQLDDSPFGGGPGMVMMIEPLAHVLEPHALLLWRKRWRSRERRRLVIIEVTARDSVGHSLAV